MGTNKNTELYMCLEATGGEHSFIENDIRNWCSLNGYEVLYYRELKEGHSPMCRETKIKCGTANNLYPLQVWLDEANISDCIVLNPHVEYKQWKKAKERGEDLPNPWLSSGYKHIKLW